MPSNASFPVKTSRSLLLLFLLLLAGRPPLHAQTCTADQEPNDEPAAAQPLTGCAAGQLSQGDQDLYRFDVAGEPALFQISLDGIPRALTRVELFRIEGNSSPISLYALQSPNGEPQTSPPILLTPGSYLLGTSAAGGSGPYRFSLNPSGSLPAAAEIEPNDQRQSAFPTGSDTINLRADTEGSVDWFSWTLSQDAAGQLWELSAQGAPGSNIRFALFDENGSLLTTTSADSSGRAAFYDLQLPPTTYFLQVDGERSSSNPYLLSAAPAGPLIPGNGRETEPNDSDEMAVPWPAAAPMSGRLAAINDDDTYSLTISPEDEGTRFDLTLTSTAPHPRELCLILPDRDLRHCRRALGEVLLADLSLPAGEYRLVVSGEAAPQDGYTLTRRRTGQLSPGQEVEPNDLFALATSMDDNRRAAGRHVGDEVDIYRFTFTGPPQLWRLQAVGDGLTRLSYLNAAGEFAQNINGQNERRIRLNNLYLLPGTHYVAVRGAGGSYNVMAIPLGPPPPGIELEPNDEPGQANPLRLGEQRTGLLNDGDSGDRYHFTLPAEEVVRLTVTPPDDGNVRTRLFGEGTYTVATNASGVEAGAPYVLETRLLPGDYSLQLSSDIVSDSAYTLLLERLDPFTQIDDVEPNDRPELAVPLPASLTMRGAVIQNNDIDWLRLPIVDEPSTFTVEVPPQITLTLTDAAGNRRSSQPVLDDASGRYTGTLPPEESSLLRITGDGSYELRFAFDRGPLQPRPRPAKLAAGIDISLENDTPAAYWPAGQQIDGQVTIRNDQSAEIAVQLAWHTSHYKIQPRWVQGQALRIPPGGAADFPFSLSIAPDLPVGDYPVTVQVFDLDGAATTGQAVLIVAPDAPPANTGRIWPIPDAMLGGFNAAALSVGAEITTADPRLAERQAALHDGYTPLADGLTWPLDDGPVELLIDLAGEEPLPLAGILLNPQGRGAQHERVRLFELLLSNDGRNFTPALTGLLQPTPIEQAFPLAGSPTARFALLRLLDNFNGGQGNVALGEWKVITRPDALLLTGANLVDPANGGYLVYADPQPGAQPDAVSLLQADGRAGRLNLDNGRTAAWVFGFQHDRAAQIERIEWLTSPEENPEERLTRAVVSTSLDSPAGPWTPAGELALSAGSTTLSLPQPIWARYVRIEAGGPDPAGERFRPWMPDTVRIIERPPGESYRSILGEWGHYNKDASYEWLTPPDELPTLAADDNDLKERAEPLAGEQTTPLAGQVRIGEDVDWYRFDVPADHNAVILELTGSPTVNVAVRFEDENGEPLPAKIEAPSASRRVITATVAPESTVYFQISEPPRSVIFSWDTSGSVSPYFDTIYNSLSTFVEGVTPGREVVNFLPFGSQPLLQSWGEEPTLLQQALNDYPRNHSSSSAETTLLEAAEALAFSEGTRAIVVITDAESGSYNETAALWRSLTAVRPRIFTMAISSNITVGQKPANEQDLMQSWAGVNAGYYDFLRTQGEMARSFERATTWLRRPAGYTITAGSAFVDPPGPGSLQLLSSSTGENAAASASLLGDTAVELILDASGSMQEPLGDGTRISAAREVLLDLVQNVLPDGVPVALRVFGNREGNFSCRTDLEVPLGPLDREALAAVVAAVEPQTNANTAIGASLALVPQDLTAAAGPKLVILLTDGEETCDGDPEQVIADLRQQGIDVRVNVVGFAIDEAALKAEFTRWAELGGGNYYDAADASQLSTSLSLALRTPFRVLDETGTIVGEGLVDGPPLSLPAGVYTIEVLTDPTTRIERVTVAGDEDVILRVSGAPPLAPTDN